MLVIISRLAFILIQMISYELRAAGVKTIFLCSSWNATHFLPQKGQENFQYIFFHLQYLHKGFQTMLQGVLLYKDHNLI